MSKIRINELARELEVKSNLVIEYLATIGFADKKSHSSALDDELAEKVRQHFHADVAESPEPVAAPPPPPVAPKPVEAPVAPPPATVVAHPPAPPPVPSRAEAVPVPRTLEQIKEDARRALAGGLKPAPAAGPAGAPGLRRPPLAVPPGSAGDVLASRPGVPSATAGVGSAAPALVRPAGSALAGAGRAVPATPGMLAGRAPLAAAGAPSAKASAPGGAKSSPSSQPIYPGIGKGAGRPAPLRRPGEHHRQLHPTTAPRAGAPLAAGTVAPRLAPRMPIHGTRSVPGGPGRPAPPLRGPA
ncbi:MAG TPA: translation initiation factor IF-2 N-terminal domain-containing protein, partial [Terriglobia bacterium]|nr:translation initiation factor IF-2 N-terminal domain-containing protein [Terriglobia bacterium]